MSMYNKKSIFENEDVSKFSPLLQFFYYDLSVDEIIQALLRFDKNPRKKLDDDENFKSRLNEVKNYVENALDDAVKEFQEIFQNESSRRESDFTRLHQAQVIFVLKFFCLYKVLLKINFDCISITQTKY